MTAKDERKEFAHALAWVTLPLGAVESMHADPRAAGNRESRVTFGNKESRFALGSELRGGTTGVGPKQHRNPVQIAGVPQYDLRDQSQGNGQQCADRAQQPAPDEHRNQQMSGGKR